MLERMDRDEVLAAAETFAAHRVATKRALTAQLKALAEREVAEIEAAAEALGPRSRGTVTWLADAFGRSRPFINQIVVNRWGPADGDGPAASPEGHAVEVSAFA